MSAAAEEPKEYRFTVMGDGDGKCAVITYPDPDSKSYAGVLVRLMHDVRHGVYPLFDRDVIIDKVSALGAKVAVQHSNIGSVRTSLTEIIATPEQATLINMFFR